MNEWFKLKEQSSGFIRLWMLFKIYKVFGAKFLKVCVIPVVFFIFIFAKERRKFSRRYFEILYGYTKDPKLKPGSFKGFKHFLSFANSLVDRVCAWSDDIKFEDMNINDKTLAEKITTDIKARKGAFILCSHLGNIEMLRGMAALDDRLDIKVNAFMETSQTKDFNDFIKHINPDSSTNIFSTMDISIDTAWQMKEKIEQGELVVMAADRMPASENKKGYDISLLGHNATLPLGAFKFAKVMESGVYGVFICSKAGKYDIYIYDCTPKDRKNAEIEMAQNFALRLQELIVKYPYQWYNFYGFWN